MQRDEQKPGWRLVDAGLFLLGLSSVLGLFLVLTMTNFLGFRGAPRESNPFARPNLASADLMVLGILGAFVVVLSVYRNEKKLARAFVYGMWAGVAASAGVIILR